MSKKLAHVHESKMKRETYLLTEVGIEKASILIDSLEENGIDSKTILEKNVGAKAMKGNNLLSAETEIAYAAEIMKGFGNKASTNEKSSICRHLIKALEYLSRGD